MTIMQSDKKKVSGTLGSRLDASQKKGGG